MKRYFTKYFELFLWVMAIILLANLHPDEDAHHTLCLFSFIGIDFCPGCGLGRSIAYFLKGQPIISLQTHPLGIFAFLMIIQRIYKIIKLHIIPPHQISKHAIR